MCEGWDYYLLLVDNKPASIYLDLGLKADAPNRKQAYMSYVRVFMRQARPDGLSSREEFEHLIAVEDALTDCFSASADTTYVGRNTSSGSRDFIFYTADHAGFIKSVEAAMARHPQYQFEIGGRPDPEWEVYLGFLYPSPDDLERIRNRRVTQQLAADGDDLSEPRMIDHVAILPSSSATSALRDFLIAHGFNIEKPKIVGTTIVLGFHRFDRPDNIDNVVTPIALRVRELGGEYDGWGCEVIN